MDLYDQIESVEVLNVDKEISNMRGTEVVISSNKDISNQKYIVSDADEELLILIGFKTVVDLKAIKLYATTQVDIDEDEDISQPKNIHIYKLDNLNVNFDDLLSLNPHKSIICDKKKLVKGQNIKLQKQSKNITKFKKVKYLAIYIETNQNETEKTILHAIQVKGNTLKANTISQSLYDPVEQKTKDPDRDSIVK